MMTVIDEEDLEWMSSVHLEYIQNRELEAIEHDEAVVRRFLAARLSQRLNASRDQEKTLYEAPERF